jgi:hypothetical protein
MIDFGVDNFGQKYSASVENVQSWSTLAENSQKGVKLG